MEIYLLILIAYLLGSIPSALIIGKVFYKTDIRKLGSGNLGATNTFRNLGKKAGISVLIIDITKGSLSILIPILLTTSVHFLIFGMAAILGHSSSIFAKFKGGKSVATSAGVFLVYQPIGFIIALFCFLVILKVSKYVSLSSIVASLALFTYSLFINDIPFMVITGVIVIFITYKHKENIKRIKNKSEPKIKWM